LIDDETQVVNARQLAIGGLALAVGVLVYVVARPPGSVAFLPRSFSHPIELPSGLRAVTGPLPTLAHALAFCLFSAGVLAGRRVRASVICASWFMIEAAFEIGQHHSVSSWLIPRLPAWIDHVWLLANMRPYFAHGTFDSMDLVAAAAGCAIGFFAITCTTITQGDLS
jgi:hypothetical protein